MSAIKRSRYAGTTILGAVFATVFAGSALSQSLAYAPTDRDGSILNEVVPQPEQAGDELPAPLRRQVVAYTGDEAVRSLSIPRTLSFI